MPEVQIRSAVATDLPILMAIDHACKTDYVWQMDLQPQEDQVSVAFREMRLPRSVTVEYSRPVSSLADEWSRKVGMLVAILDKQQVGYTRITDRVVPRTAWITDLVVAPRFRKMGIGTALIMSAQNWALERKNLRIFIEMSSKQHPAISLAQKIGYEFCGYNDHYYANQDITLFFGRTLR